MAAVKSSSRVNEPVTVSAVDHGFFPSMFVWRGRRHDVRSVEDCRTEVRRDWRGQARRHLFRVRTDGAVFELAQDIACGTWRVERIWPQI